MDQCFFGNLVGVFVSGDSVFFGRGGILSCSSSTCALCFFLSPITIWPEEYEVAKSAPRQWPKIYDCANDACLSHKNPETASVPSQLPQSASSVTGHWCPVSPSFLLGFFSDSCHHNRGRRAGLKELLYYCFKYTSYADLHSLCSSRGGECIRCVSIQWYWLYPES